MASVQGVLTIYTIGVYFMYCICNIAQAQNTILPAVILTTQFKHCSNIRYAKYVLYMCIIYRAVLKGIKA